VAAANHHHIEAGLHEAVLGSEIGQNNLFLAQCFT
jgi:hypothetical protein